MKRINIIQLAKKTTVMVLSALMLTSSVPSQAIAEAVDEAATAVAQARAAQDDGQTEHRAIVFDGNGATSGQMGALDVTADADAQLPACGFTRDGATFTGWSTTASGKDTADAHAYSVNEAATLRRFVASYDENQDGQIGDDERVDLTALAKNGTVTLYAQWAEEDQTPSTEDAVELKDDADLVDAPKLADHEVAELDSAAPEAARAVAADPADDAPVKADGTSIDSASVSWITKDTAGHDDGDARKLTLVPNGNGTFDVRMNVRFQLSGENDYEPGTIRVTIPKTVIRARDGKALGTMTLSVPEAPSDRASFAYYELDDSYVLVNMVKLAASTPALFEFTQHDVTPNQVFGDPATEVEGINPSVFSATVEVTTAKGTTLSRSDSITATVDTAEQLADAGSLKSQNNSVYDKWQSSWPESLKPKNADDYAYIDWYGYATTQGNQSFTSGASFTLPDGYPDGTLVLGLMAPDGSVVTADEGASSVASPTSDTLQYQRSLTAHAFIAIPRDAVFDGAAHEYTGKMEFTITSVDDCATSTKDLEGTATYTTTTTPKPTVSEQKLPNSVYRVEKSGSYYEGALDRLASGKNVFLSYRINALQAGGTDLRNSTFDSAESFSADQIADDATMNMTLVDDAVSENGLAGAYTADEYEYSQLDFSSARAYGLVALGEDGRASTTPGSLGVYLKKGSWVYNAIDAAYIPEFTVEAKSRDGEWSAIATVSFDNGSAAISLLAGASAIVSGSKLMFTSGADYVGVRVTANTKIKQQDSDGNQVIVAAIQLNLNPTIRLKASSPKLVQRIQQLYEESSLPVLSVQNTARLEAKCADHAVRSQYSAAQDRLGGGALLRVQKTQSATSSRDGANSRYKVTYTARVYEQTSLTSKDNYEAAVADGLITPETSGTFYDLLPQGVYPDINSITLREGDKIESVTTKRDYNGSGRTLLVVKATLKPRTQVIYNGNSTGVYGDVPYMTFNATYSYDDAAELGDKLVNVMAFESGNDPLGGMPGYMGENNNTLRAGSSAYNNYGTASAVKGFEEVLRGLNPLDTGRTFVYSRTEIQMPTVDHAYVSDLDLKVAANDSGDYVQGTKQAVNVYDGGAYSYKLRSVNQEQSGGIKNVVLYDNLETATPAGENEGDTTWHGTFTGVDVSAMRAAGIAPVVYYATREVDLSKDSADLDLSGDAWSTEAPADLSQVRAIAIDASKQTDGTDYVLAGGKTVSAIVNMKAPAAAQLAGEGADASAYYDSDSDTEEGLDGGAHAYNSAVATSRLTNGTQLYGESATTKVGLAEHLVSVEKVWDDQDNIDSLRPSEITATLVANGRATELSAVLNGSNNWKASFTGAPAADEQGNPIHYAVVESATEGDGNLGAYYASQAQATSQNADPHYQVIDEFTLTNFHDPAVTVLAGSKTWDDENNAAGKRPTSIKVDLYADGVLTQTQTVRADADDTWLYEFKNLPVNKAPNTPIKYTVDEQYVPGYDTQIAADGTITNKYDPYGSLTIVENALQDATQAALDRNPDFTFKVDLTTADGEPDGGRYAYSVLGADGAATGATGYIGTGESIKLKQGQSVRIEQIPSETTYSVTQTDASGCKLVKSEQEQGSIRAGESHAAKALFTNAYVSKGAANITATKVLQGGTLAAGQYTFQMYKGDTVVRTGYNDKNGAVVFGRVNYTQADDGQTYSYVIKEKPGTRLGVIYSQAEITVTVTPHDNGDGTMTCDVVYEGGDGTDEEKAASADTKQIVNTYQAQGDVSLTSWKELKNGTLSDGQFSFALTAETEDAPLPAQTTVANDASGQITFGPITFNQDNIGKSYSYIVRENAAADDTTTVYDDGAFRYTVTPRDNGDGTLSFDQKVARVAADGSESEVTGAPTFVNKAADGSLRVEKYAQGGDTDTEFTFWLQLNGNEGQELPGSITPTMEQLDGNNAPDLHQNAIEADQNQATSGNGIIDTLSSWGSSLLGLFMPTSAYAATTSVEGKFSAPSTATYTYTTNTNTTTWTQTRTLTIHAGTLATSGVNSIMSLAGNDELKYGPDYIVFDYGVEITRGDYLFDNCTNLEGISGYAPTIKCTSLINAFTNCQYLRTLDGLSGWDVSNVTSFASMFYNCWNLTSISGLAYWNTSKATTMSNMFNSCRKLTSTDALKNWNVQNVTTFEQIFYGCSKLSSLSGLSNWNTSKVTTLYRAFSGCSSLSSLDGLSNWNVQNVTNLQQTFNQCSGLRLVSGLSNWNTSKVTNLSSAFAGCSSLSSLDGLENWNVSKISNCYGTFSNCSGLISIGALSNWDTANLQSIASIFDSCSKLTSLAPLSKWKTAKVGSLIYSFYGCSSLTSLDGLENWNVSNVTSCESTFTKCASLASIDALKNWDASKVETFRSTFNGCSSLTSVESLSKWNTVSVTEIRYAFQDCKALASLDGLNSWDVSKVTNFNSVFSGCSSLLSLDGIHDWDVSSVQTISRAFFGCSALKSMDGIADWNVAAITTYNEAFRDCSSLASLDAIGSWNMASVVNFNQVFQGCSSARSVTIPASLAQYFQRGGWGEDWLPNAKSGGIYTGNWVRSVNGVQSSDRKDVASGYGDVSEYARDHAEEAPLTFVWQTTPTATVIVFDANGASGSMANHAWDHGSGSSLAGTTLPKNTLYKYDNEFLGWNTAADGSGAYYDDAAVIDKDDANFPAGATVTLYAQWKATDHTAQKTDRGYKITLHGNEAAIINDLPAAVGYQLYEETCAGWVLVGSRDASGTIQAGQTSTATFVNSYEPTKTAATIQATKILDGAPAAAGAFQFELYSVDPDGTQTKLQTVSNSAGGSVVFDPIEYIAAGTYTYQVREVAGSDSSVTYDSAVHNVTVTVTDTDGVLSNTVSYDGGDVLPVFKNESKRASLTVTKKVVGTEDTGKAFAFDVKLGQAAPQTIELRAGESKTFDNLQVGTAYTVTEKDLPGGYTAEQESYSGTVSADGAQVTVTNRYAVAETTVGITATKKLVGGTLATGQFKFGLYRHGAGASAEPLAVAYNDAQGNVAFSPVAVYADTDFDVREIVEDSNADVTYDATSSRTVHVTVTDNGDGTQTAKQEGEPPVFTNTMKTGALVVSNELRDATAASRGTRFTYTITALDENGEPLANLPITAGDTTGTVASGGTFILTGGQSARIELPSRARYTVTQTAAEGFTTAASGTAGTVNAANADAATAGFVNIYSATGAFTPSVKKEFRGEALEAGAFEFELRDGAGAYVASAKNAADGSVEFPQVAFDQAEFTDVTSKQLAYTVQEIAGGRDDVQYDTDPVSIAVTVTDDGRGHLTPQVAYSKGDLTGDAAGIITNLRTVILPRTGRAGVWGGIAAGLAVLAAGCVSLTRRRRRE